MRRAHGILRAVEIRVREGDVIDLALSVRESRAAVYVIAAAAMFAAAAAATAQQLDIPVLAAPPELRDFANMQPSDAVRARYAVVSGFTQRAPQDGAASLQRTDVYLAYDSSNLYAVFVAFDTSPRTCERTSRRGRASTTTIASDSWSTRSTISGRATGSVRARRRAVGRALVGSEQRGELRHVL